MGGRGAYALRRQHRTTVSGTFRGSGFNRSNPAFSGSGGGGGVSEVIDGRRVNGASNEQIKQALGANFNRAEVVRITGAPSGSSVGISVSGNSVTVTTRNTRANFSSSFRLEKEGSGVTFVGSSLFSGNANSSSGGAAIRGVTKGLKHGVQTGRITKARVPSAIGSAGDARAQGSGLWARMGISTNLSNVYGLPPRPPGLRQAKTVADLQLTKAGRAWWAANRRQFSGEINFKDKRSSAYKVAKKFLGIRS